jgi:hypothetical protein
MNIIKVKPKGMGSEIRNGVQRRGIATEVGCCEHGYGACEFGKRHRMS